MVRDGEGLRTEGWWAGLNKKKLSRILEVFLMNCLNLRGCSLPYLPLCECTLSLHPTIYLLTNWSVNTKLSYWKPPNPEGRNMISFAMLYHFISVRYCHFHPPKSLVFSKWIVQQLVLLLLEVGLEFHVVIVTLSWREEISKVTQPESMWVYLL